MPEPTQETCRCGFGRAEHGWGYKCPNQLSGAERRFSPDGVRVVRNPRERTHSPEVTDHAFEGDGSADPTYCWCGRTISEHLRH